MNKVSKGVGRVGLVSMVLVATAGPAQAVAPTSDSASAPGAAVYAASEAFGAAATATGADRPGEGEGIVIITPVGAAYAVGYAVAYGVGYAVGYALAKSSGGFAATPTLQASMLD